LSVSTFSPFKFHKWLLFFVILNYLIWWWWVHAILASWILEFLRYFFTKMSKWWLAIIAFAGLKILSFRSRIVAMNYLHLFQISIKGITLNSRFFWQIDNNFLRMSEMVSFSSIQRQFTSLSKHRKYVFDANFLFFLYFQIFFFFYHKYRFLLFLAL